MAGCRAGVTSVIVFAMAFYLASFFSTASGRHMIASVWLWLQGRLPRRSTDFLDDARTRGALRPIGGIYQYDTPITWLRKAIPHRYR
jgi:hypothetical protein